MGDSGFPREAVEVDRGTAGGKSFVVDGVGDVPHRGVALVSTGFVDDVDQGFHFRSHERLFQECVAVDVAVGVGDARALVVVEVGCTHLVEHLTGPCSHVVEVPALPQPLQFNKVGDGELTGEFGNFSDLVADLPTADVVSAVMDIAGDGQP